MKICKYLESKPDNYTYEIVYQFVSFCPKCKKTKTIDDYDYRTSGTIKELKKRIKLFKLMNYEPIYRKIDLEDRCIKMEETETGVTITVTKDKEERVCDECELKQEDRCARCGRYAKMNGIVL